MLRFCCECYSHLLAAQLGCARIAGGYFKMHALDLRKRITHIDSITYLSFHFALYIDIFNIEVV